MQFRDVDNPASSCILVAEDDYIVRMIVKKMLEQAGYVADFVSDGQEAIKALESKKYDLVVMDCLMPEMDGFTASRLIRESDSGLIDSQIPIIALTGLTENDDRQRCLDAGMNMLVNKPVDMGTLIAAIEKCLGRPEIEEVISQQTEVGQNQAWDDGFLNTILDRFLSEVPGVIADLSQAIELEDAVGLQNIGHRLRGATDILKMSTISERSRALEQAGKTGDIQLASKLALKLIKDLDKLSAALEE